MAKRTDSSTLMRARKATNVGMFHHRLDTDLGRPEGEMAPAEALEVGRGGLEVGEPNKEAESLWSSKEPPLCWCFPSSDQPSPRCDCCCWSLRGPKVGPMVQR